MEDAPDLRLSNRPPSPLDFAREAFAALSDYLRRQPAIVDEDQAREAKLMLDRSAACLKDLEEAREKEARPLWQRWQDARARYAPSLDRLGKLIGELKDRMTAYARAEEARRLELANEAMRKAEEAMRAADAAEEAEREARDNASQGDLEADVGAAMDEARARIDAARRASEAAQRAERDAHVRIGGGFQRATGLKVVKVLVIDDPVALVRALTSDEPVQGQWPARLYDAMRTAARAYQKATGKLPDGVHEEVERKI